MASPDPEGDGPRQRASAADGDRLTVGGILRAFLPDLFGSLDLPKRKLRVLANLGACGQPELLGHCVYECSECNHRHWTPRSCGDRHCPRCLSAKSREWLDKQMESLLPVTYYHCVFTLPSELRPLALGNQEKIYALLFDAAAQTLLEFGRNRFGGDLGVTAVLHTWGQQLSYHPHLHCIVTGGALSADGKSWRGPKQRGFLFHVKALGAAFRNRFLKGLRALVANGEVTFPEGPLREPLAQARWFSECLRQKWNVHAKRPFGGPDQVLQYLANYTHRVAISNRRIVAVDEARREVTLRYRDYADGSKEKFLPLSAKEFIRRFSLHILPPGLVRIRHYGILGNNRRKSDIAIARELVPKRRERVVAQAPTPAPTLPESHSCPFCKVALRLVAIRDRHGVEHAIGRKRTDSS